MNIGRVYLLLAVLIVLFCLGAFTVFSTPSLQWPGADRLTWPVAIGFLAISVIALLFPLVPYGRRGISSSANKTFFAIGYAILACYTLLGIAVILLYHLRRASGV